MVCYEVNIRLPKKLRQEYADWLPDHIQHVLETPGFLSAESFEVECLEEEMAELKVLYRVSSREALERYLQERAPKMRQAATDLFGDQAQVTRRIMKLSSDFAGR